jgi:hypothetical protein
MHRNSTNDRPPFNDGHAFSEFGRLNSAFLASWTAPDNNEIEMFHKSTI